jgi:hypothetical protein
MIDEPEHDPLPSDDHVPSPEPTPARDTKRNNDVTDAPGMAVVLAHESATVPGALCLPMGVF